MLLAPLSLDAQEVGDGPRHRRPCGDGGARRRRGRAGALDAAVGFLRRRTDASRSILPGGGTYTLVVVAEGFRTAEREIESSAAVEAEGPLRFALERLFFEAPGLTVTANRGTHPGDAPTSVAVISGDELERRSVANLTEALPFAQGVTFNAGQMDIPRFQRTVARGGQQGAHAARRPPDAGRSGLVRRLRDPPDPGRGTHRNRQRAALDALGHQRPGGCRQCDNTAAAGGNPNRGAGILRPLQHPPTHWFSPTNA